MKSIPSLLILFLFSLSFCESPAKSGSEVIVIHTSDPENLSPVNYSNENALQILNLIYQGLLVVDLEDNQIKPLLVKELPYVTQNDSLSFFAYEIRKEATWDNGKPITGHDVALTLKVLKCPLLNNDALRPRFDFIRGILLDTVDNRKFTIVTTGYNQEMDLLTGDFMVLPSYLLDPDSLLVPFSIQELSGNQEWLNQQPAIKAYVSYFNTDRFTRNQEFLRGSGGYTLEDWKTGQHVVLGRKTDWWGNRISPSLGHLTAIPNQIRFQVVPENRTALLALQNGQVDVLEGIPSSDFIKLEADSYFKAHYNLFTPETYEVAVLGLNSRLDKFADRRTRQALAYLLDIDNIIQATQGKFASKTVGPINPTNTTYYNSDIKSYKLSQKYASDLLTQAGWTRHNGAWEKHLNGKLIKLSVDINYKAGYNIFENTALIFQQAAASVDIPVNLVPMESSLLSSKLRNHEFEAFIRSFSGSPFALNFKPILHTENATINGSNFTRFGNEESDFLIEAINVTRDEAQRAKLLKRLQEILHEECNLIFLYFTKNRIAVSNRFTNLKISGIKPGYDISAFSVKAL